MRGQPAGLVFCQACKVRSEEAGPIILHGKMAPLSIARRRAVFGVQLERALGDTSWAKLMGFMPSRRELPRRAGRVVLQQCHIVRLLRIRTSFGLGILILKRSVDETYSSEGALPDREGETTVFLRVPC